MSATTPLHGGHVATVLAGELPTRMVTGEALAMLLAIGYQESRLMYRRQHGGGPARGLWQFERGGGCLGVLTHPESRVLMASACRRRGIEPASQALWDALERDDDLAMIAARLLLWTDPYALPSVGQRDRAWAAYLRVWRPGKPHPGTWAGAWEEGWRRASIW